MYERAKVAAKKSKAKEFKTIQTQKNRFNNHSSPFDQILFLQRTIGNQAVENLFKSGIIQAKLKIGKSNDIYEQEADRVAEQIVSSSWSIVNNQVEEGEIQRQTEEEERKKEEEEEETLQLKKMQGNISEVTPDIESRIRTLRGSGQPLPKSIRAFFEPRFGYDFSYVRIHTDPEAAKLARALNAEAFTYGRDIYFGEGRYNPNTLTGKRLLAHELTHVIQQSKKNFYQTSTNLLQKKVRPNYVSCNSYPRTYPIFKVIGTTDPVSIIQTADTKAIEYLDLVINKLESTRRGILTKISAGQPIATAISPYKSITSPIQTRFGINPRVPTVWTGSGYGSVSVIIKRYKAVKKMLQGGWVHYICLSKRCKSNVYAFVDSPRYFIYLCRLFWTSCPPSCRALTLIHEALHIYFWPFLGDTGALANAYRYEDFIEDIVSKP